MSKTILAIDVGYGNTKLVFGRDGNCWNELVFKSVAPTDKSGSGGHPAGISDSLDRITVPKVFGWLARVGGLSEPEMLRTFNCGVGMLCAVAKEDASKLVEHLAAAGETAAIVGELRPRTAEPVTFSGALAL